MADALREAEQFDDRFALINLNALSIMQLALADDDSQNASRAVACARESLSGRGYHLQQYLCLSGEVQASLYQGRRAEAYQRIAAEEAALKRSLLMRVFMVRSTLFEMRARAAVAAAREAKTGLEAEQLLQAAERDVRRLEREGARRTNAVATLLRGAIQAARAQRDQACETLKQAVDQLHGAHMGMHVAAARRQLGLLRGEQGRVLVAEADASMVEQTVKSPARIARMLVPIEGARLALASQGGAARRQRG